MSVAWFNATFADSSDKPYQLLDYITLTPFRHASD